MISFGDIQALIAANWQGARVPVLSVSGTGQTISLSGKSVKLRLTRADLAMTSDDFVSQHLAPALAALKTLVG